MPHNLQEINRALRGKDPLDIIAWAIDYSQGRALVSTNFRPLEAVILHLATRVKPDLPVLWVDTGYNTPETYRFAESLIQRLRLNVKRFIPLRTAAHRDALNRGIPAIEDPTHDEFTREVKLEPFERGLRELDPRVWFTALRREQTPFRETLDYASEHTRGILKVSPVFYFSEAQMEDYLRTHDLPDEKNYYDPTKVLEKRECGLHLNPQI